jgi:hypothetical protein
MTNERAREQTNGDRHEVLRIKDEEIDWVDLRFTDPRQVAASDHGSGVVDDVTSPKA